MTCKECLHNEMCYATHTDNSPACCDFKDKNRFVEVVRCIECERWQVSVDQTHTWCSAWMSKETKKMIIAVSE